MKRSLISLIGVMIAGVALAGGNVVPHDPTTNSLGTSTLKWKDVYASGDIVGGNISNVSSTIVGSNAVFSAGMAVTTTNRVQGIASFGGTGTFTADGVATQAFGVTLSGTNYIVLFNYLTDPLGSNYCVTLRETTQVTIGGAAPNAKFTWGIVGYK